MLQALEKGGYKIDCSSELYKMSRKLILSRYAQKPKRYKELKREAWSQELRGQRGKSTGLLKRRASPSLDYYHQFDCHRTCDSDDDVNPTLVVSDDVYPSLESESAEENVRNHARHDAEDEESIRWSKMS